MSDVIDNMDSNTHQGKSRVHRRIQLLAFLIDKGYKQQSKAKANKILETDRRI
jgi:hypothetical protein